MSDKRLQVKQTLEHKLENSTLVKFGRLEHLESLRDRGELFMNTLEYFWKIEGDPLRKDPYDCADKVVRHTSGLIELTPKNGKKIVGNVSNFEYWEFTKRPDLVNLYCMFALQPAFRSYPIDKRNYEFGEYAFVLQQSKEFIDRINLHLEENKINASMNLVDYVSESYAGEIGPFRKRDSYAYQSEWRLVAKNGEGTSRILNIGSLAEIGVIVRAEEINIVVPVGS